MNRSYVLYAAGQNYIDHLRMVVEYLLKISKYHVILCYAEGSVDYADPRLITIKMDIPYLIDFNVKSHDPKNVRRQYLLTYKPNVCEAALLNTQFDEFLYIDADIIVTPNIEKMCDDWSKRCTEYPLFSRYCSDEFYVEGRKLVLDKILNLRNISRKNQSVVPVTTALFFFNRKCFSFIQEWVSFVHSQEYIDAFVKEDGLGNKELAQYNDEQGANVLMWYHGYDRYIGPMVWTSLAKCVEYVLNAYKVSVPLILHPHHKNEHGFTHGRTPLEYAYPYQDDTSIFPVNKRDLFAFHSIKDAEEYKMGVKYIEQLY